MATNKTQEGKIVTCVAPSGGVVSGTAYKIGQLLVVAVTTEDEGDNFEGETEGVFTLPKATGALTDKALVYWDDSAAKVTTTAASNMLCGCAQGTAASGDATASIRLDGVARPDEAAG